MKPISAAYFDAWNRKDGRREMMQVQYKRRYWNGSAYVYEANWHILARDQWSQIGDIPYELDTPFLNVFKTTTPTIRLDNTFNQWISDASDPSVFAADAVATSGYDDHLTKFQIAYGYVLADGTTEYTNIFTGVMIEPVPSAKVGYAEAILSDNSILLDAADPTQIITTVTLENCSPATGDGVNKVFLTTSTGVYQITDVQVDGVSLVQGTDYNVSNASSSSQVIAATITFVNAPGNTKTVKVSLTKWKQGQKIEDVIGLLCDQAGIGSGQRTIQPALFPGGAAGQVKINTQAQWLAATLANVDALAVVNSIVLGAVLTNRDFETGDFTSWNAASNSVGNGSGSTSVQTSVVHSGTYAAKLTDVGPHTGPVTFTEYVQIVDGSGNIVATQTLSGGSGWQQGSITVPYASANLYYLRFLVSDSTGTYARITSVQSISAAGTNTTITFWWQSAGIINGFTGGRNLYIDDVYAHVATGTNGTALTAEIDLGAAPSSWGVLIASGSQNGGGWSFKTQTSTTSGSGYDALVPLNAANVPTSALKRYLKIQATLTPGSLPGHVYPQLDQILLNYTTSTVLISLVDFTSIGTTCWDAVQKLAQLCDYEVGFDTEGNFFFRTKIVSGSVVMKIDQENCIQDINNHRKGYDQVINASIITYGPYVNVYDGAVAGEASPTSEKRFGRVVQKEDWSNILLVNDVNIAKGRAQLLYQNNYLPKRRFRVVGDITPFIELADTLDVTYVDSPLLMDNIAGDPAEDVGQPGNVYSNPGQAGPAHNVIAMHMKCKVIAVNHKPDSGTGEMILQEILS